MDFRGSDVVDRSACKPKGSFVRAASTAVGDDADDVGDVSDPNDAPSDVFVEDSVDCVVDGDVCL